jgi:hypothetical protein
MMHLRYIRLDKIRETFAQRCAYLGITLPEKLWFRDWGRTAHTPYAREEKGNRLGAALSLLRRDIRNQREYEAAKNSAGGAYG